MYNKGVPRGTKEKEKDTPQTRKENTMTSNSKVTDATIRANVFNDLDVLNHGWQKINDRQVGILVDDGNGVTRYVRLGVIVAEIREDMTAAELMQSEIDKYNATQAEKARKAAERKAKAEKDAAKRAEKAAKEAE